MIVSASPSGSLSLSSTSITTGTPTKTPSTTSATASGGRFGMQAALPTMRYVKPPAESVVVAWLTGWPLTLLAKTLTSSADSS